MFLGLVFSFDETILYWCMAPARSLGTRNLPEIKLYKASIVPKFVCSIVLYGPHKLRLWTLGKSCYTAALRHRDLTICQIELTRNDYALPSLYCAYLVFVISVV